MSPATLLLTVLCIALLGGIVWGFVAALSSQQSSMLVATETLCGRLGVVVTGIDKNATGEVGVSRGETAGTFLARAHSGSAIPRGQPVRVVRVVGSMLFVEEVSAFQPMSTREKP